MNADRDPVDAYLDDLAPRLQGPADRVRRILAEAEAHLTEAASVRPAAGAARIAQEEAVARFGSAADFAESMNRQAWRRDRTPVLRAGLRLLMKLASVGLITTGITGVLARLVAVLTSTVAVYGFPAAADPSAESCAHWLAVHPAAAGCRQAATLEASSDLTLALLAAGIAGLIIRAALVLERRIGKKPVATLPPILGPALAAAAFVLAAAGCGLLAASDVVVLSTWGAGLYWTAAATCAGGAAVAVVLVLGALPGSYAGPLTDGGTDTPAVA